VGGTHREGPSSGDRTVAEGERPGPKTALVEDLDATEDLRLANETMARRVAELDAINQLGIALSATLDIDQLVDRALASVVTHLDFDRALVLLADADGRALGHGRCAGGTPELAAVLEAVRLPVEPARTPLARMFGADGPMLFIEADREPWGPSSDLARALGVTALLGTPLVAKRRTVGVLAVDRSASGRPLEPDDGPLLFTLGNIVAAAVENARLYAEVEAQKQELEERVARRTAQLADAVEAAQAARAAAEAASEAKSSFLTSVSHELRTPLTSVIGFTRIVQRRLDEVVFPAVGAEDPRVRRAMRQVDENLEIMLAEGERLTTLIDDSLDLAKIEAGRFDWVMRPLEPDELVRRSTAATAALFETSGLELVTVVAPALPTFTGDRDRLIQVLINLISNAIKATSRGSVTVRADPDPEGVLLSVIDTGMGIDPADQDRIWEPYRQAGPLADRPVGTGLGLPICRRIVERHGGRIWLESEPGRGSAFLVRLPVEPPGAGDGEEDQSARGGPLHSG
jgi:signal transduction histidine kinase